MVRCQQWANGSRARLAVDLTDLDVLGQAQQRDIKRTTARIAADAEAVVATHWRGTMPLGDRLADLYGSWIGGEKSSSCAES